MEDLFTKFRPDREELAEGVVLLANYADTSSLLPKIERLLSISPLRHMKTPGGHTMSVAMSNCGTLGWTTSESGYRYSEHDPLTGAKWPAMPETFSKLANLAAEAAGFNGFKPDACLINRYEPSARLTPHQDKNEQDMAWPIVSVSMGVPAVFQLYGASRSGTPKLIELHDGDVMVWGGMARLYYHGVKPIKNAQHALTGLFRYNLTFRKAG